MESTHYDEVLVLHTKGVHDNESVFAAVGNHIPLKFNYSSFNHSKGVHNSVVGYKKLKKKHLGVLSYTIHINKIQLMSNTCSVSGYAGACASGGNSGALSGAAGGAVVGGWMGAVAGAAGGYAAGCVDNMQNHHRVCSDKERKDQESRDRGGDSERGGGRNSEPPGR